MRTRAGTPGASRRYQFSKPRAQLRNRFLEISTLGAVIDHEIGASPLLVEGTLLRFASFDFRCAPLAGGSSSLDAMHSFALHESDAIAKSIQPALQEERHVEDDKPREPRA